MSTLQSTRPSQIHFTLIRTFVACFTLSSDKCYGTCGSSRDKCDKEFRTCMMSQCSNKKNKKERDDCEGQASMFFTGTRSLGCQAYIESQKEACTCGPLEKVKSAAKKVERKISEIGEEVKNTVKTGVNQAKLKEEL